MPFLDSPRERCTDFSFARGVKLPKLRRRVLGEVPPEDDTGDVVSTVEVFEVIVNAQCQGHSLWKRIVIEVANIDI